MKKLIASILIVLLMIPTVAFAESTHTLSKLDLTASGHSDKTLENDGYTWDAANAVLTLQDISVGGDIILPKRDCTINIQGTCYAGIISRPSSADVQSLPIYGAEGADLSAAIDPGRPDHDRRRNSQRQCEPGVQADPEEQHHQPV